MICPRDHKHGETSTCYTAHKCRCDECRSASTDYARESRRRMAAGRWAGMGFRPAGPTQAHLLRLTEFGWSLLQVAEASGLPMTTVHAVAKAERVSERTAEAIAKVSGAPRTGFVSAVGIVRRVNGLALLGWSRAEVTRRAGLARVTVDYVMQGRNRRVQSRVVEAVAAVTDELMDLVPRQPEWVTSRVVREAQARGAVPLLAWDDLDDPNEKPKGVKAA